MFIWYFIAGRLIALFVILNSLPSVIPRYLHHCHSEGEKRLKNLETLRFAQSDRLINIILTLQHHLLICPEHRNRPKKRVGFTTGSAQVK